MTATEVLKQLKSLGKPLVGVGGPVEDDWVPAIGRI